MYVVFLLQTSVPRGNGLPWAFLSITYFLVNEGNAFSWPDLDCYRAGLDGFAMTVAIIYMALLKYFQELTTTLESEP